MVTYLMSKSRKKSQEQIRETEIRNLAQTQGTASVLRSDAAQEQNRRTTAEATRGRSIGTQKGRLKQIAKGTQVESRMRSSQTQTDPETRSGTTQSGAPEIFDMAVDDIADVAIEQADAEMEAAREAKEKERQNAMG